METPEATRRRRSIRNYTDRPVPEELVNERLNAALPRRQQGTSSPGTSSLSGPRIARRDPDSPSLRSHAHVGVGRSSGLRRPELGEVQGLLGAGLLGGKGEHPPGRYGVGARCRLDRCASDG